MIDFMMVSTRSTKRGVIEIYPKFIVKKSSDLMIRGGDFYAIWIEERGLWSTDEQDALQLIDRELDRYADEHRREFESDIKVMHMWDAESGMIDRWHKYCQKHMRDSYHSLDDNLIFSNTVTGKKDYASKRLNYPLEAGDISAYDRLMSVLYSEKERQKIEWAIGSIVTGDSKRIQKFVVLYGEPKSGKSTVLNIIQQLFDGYWSAFDARALGSSSNSFALEAFKSNPLVAIQHDGDLSRIEDNTRLNSLVSHEVMTVNEKFKAAYVNQFKCFLFMGTNKPVKITDGKSGLIRRLIDVTPTGNRLSRKEYDAATKQIQFELGAIAYHCKEVYLSNPRMYDDYIPINMLGASNDFYNFIIDAYHVFKRDDGTTMKAAWEMYKAYCDEAKVNYIFPQRIFKEELKTYFRDFQERFNLDDGTRVRSYYSGFRTEKFDGFEIPDAEPEKQSWLTLDSGKSILDDICATMPAQYASEEEKPTMRWSSVKTTLADIDTSKLHYVKLPENHIVIDFDIPDASGKKSLKKNLEKAELLPPTYAELSKSGAGLHLHYIYQGDPSKLSRVYDDNVEIKVFAGNSSLRRKLTKCNSLPVTSISSGLPMKGVKKMVNFDGVKSEKQLRTFIEKNLAKEYHANTKPSIDFIMKGMDEAYASGVSYDVSDMYNAIFAFASNSTHQAENCIKLIDQMRFKSRDKEEQIPSDISGENHPIAFFDTEVFPNLFLVNWKCAGLGQKIHRMINPKPEAVEELLSYNLIGFNCRRYDNHMLYARLMGYDNEQLYKLSKGIVNGNKNCFFGEAYNISYTDIYDFASAGNKKSLKKLEIEMGNTSEKDLVKRGFSEEEIGIIKAGTHHQELGLPWDQPVPVSQWSQVAEYCDNDVLATEATFIFLKPDWEARQILADLAGMSKNDTTNSLSTRIIFGTNRHPQDEFNYRNLAEPVKTLTDGVKKFLKAACPEMMEHTHGEEKSLLPYFPGYKYDKGISMYRGEEIGEGGYVYAEPGMYHNVALLDVSSMHPHSMIAEVLFGIMYTSVFRDIVESRVSIKHKDWDTVGNMLEGKLVPYIQNVIDGKISAKDLANALKTAINSVYGLTAASFDNPFRDPRNIDNIVAKRGALFMVDLKHAVQEKGFTVAHIKTDSIKIPDATPEIIQFVMDFGKRYGYTFEHEATYERMCLVNDAVYIAKYDNGEWTATGAQFAVPYVFKTLFSHEPIQFQDLCETKAVSTALYLDMNEECPDVHEEEKRLTKLELDYKKGLLSDKTFEDLCKGLPEKIAEGHNYQFVGRVGLFCPIKEGCGGGSLMREKDGKYYNATGAKGYRWLESEVVRRTGKEADIDKTYYNHLVDDAVETISRYGDFEQFVSDDPLAFAMNPPETN